MASAGGQPTGGSHKREYLKEYTLSIDVIDNGRVKAKAVLESLVKLIGAESIYTCVPKAGNTWEVTLADREAVEVALEGVKVGENTYECREITQQTVVVSFMHLSGYIQDSQIEDKLREYGVELVSDIKRRLHPDFHIEDGTRFVRVKFPPDFKSLPYTMKFFNGRSYEQYRVIHNDQTKMCRQCNSDKHLMRDCPQFVCYKCGRQGHIARACKEPQCENCEQYGLKCTCETIDDADSIQECEYCHRYDCYCYEDLCENCEKPINKCVCLPDDICKHCSVELENCQCMWCEYCNKRDCNCQADDWGDKRPGNVAEQQVGKPSQADHNRREDPIPANDKKSADRCASKPNSSTSTATERGGSSQPILPISPAVDRSGPDNKPSDGTVYTQQTKSVNKGEQHVTTDSDTDIYLGPGGQRGDKKLFVRPSPATKSTDTTSDIDMRDESGRLLHRRRRMVTEPHIPNVKVQRIEHKPSHDID